MFQQNVGNAERPLRAALAATLLAGGAAAALVGGKRGRRVAAVALPLGAMEVATTATRYCPMNDALGIDTVEESNRLWERILPDALTPTEAT